MLTRRRSGSGKPFRLGIAFVCVALSLPASAQSKKERAFGITKGLSLAGMKKLGAVRQVEPYHYELTSPPAPVDLFVAYSVALTPKTGVCAVMAATPRQKPRSAQLRESLSMVVDALTKKYGPQVPSSETGEGFVAAWNDALGPDTSITVGEVNEGATARIMVFYAFSNFVECRAEMRGGL